MTPWSRIIDLGLEEDIGRGDVTSNALIPAGIEAEATFVAKQDLIVCGLPVVAEVFRRIDSRVRLLPEVSDGSGALPGNSICDIRGPARAVMAGERLALNLMQNLSGVATLTRRFVDQVQGTGVRIADTRKTTPGMRWLQKYAVRVGGGVNHRMGLDDGFLIKENHITLAGGVKQAVRRAHAATSHLHRIEVECETLTNVRDALDAGAHVLLLDNMDLEAMREAVALVDGKALLEASGNVTLDTVRAIAETGINMISVGAITHSAGSCDISLLVDYKERSPFEGEESESQHAWDEAFHEHLSLPPGPDID
ncbi:MAG: carboxylating nicotinate-nucleotide diphosphorylase [Magnetococcales bacterium]|nr:carboxylating nicotinate-nucleotide diphosphorylase [Magnetococcales bacterium]